MPEVRSWLARHHEEFTSRPVRIGSHSAWHRIVPRVEIDRAIGAIEKIGSIFP